MKQVFTDISTIAHLWANKVQESARNTGNFYFEKDTIYSYGSHFPIATHFNDVVLFTLRTYSVTTSKHLQVVRGATSHLNKIYCRNPLEVKYGDHDKNIQYWVDNIVSIARSLATARKPEKYISQIEAEKEQLNKYLTYFKLKLSKAQSKLITFSDTQEFIQAQKDAANTLKRANAAKLKLGEKVYFKRWELWRNFVSVEDMNFTSKEQEAANFYNRTIDGNITYLRTDGVMVFTSKGVKLPVSVAQRYFKYYLDIIKKGGCTDCDYKMLDYQVREASEKALIVGCHNMPMNEIQILAKKLNWI